MTARLRQWREETHGTAGELVRHFLARFFDNEMITIPGEWQKVAVSLFAAIVSVAITGALSENLFVGRTMQFQAELEQKIRDLTLEAVKAALRKHVDLKRFSVVTAGDFNKKK